MLNEAIVRVLDGSRPWPPGVPLLAFLSGVMRSICDDHWRRLRREALTRRGDVADLAATAEEPSPDPERTLAAAQALGEIDRLFAGDRPVLQIIAGLSEGLTAREICRVYEMTERDYDTARKRMRRALLRCGLTWGAPMKDWRPHIDLARLSTALAEEILAADEQEVREVAARSGHSLAGVARDVRRLIAAASDDRRGRDCDGAAEQLTRQH